MTLTGELAVLGQIRAASNVTLLCDAAQTRCVYKPVRGEQPLWDFPDGTLAGREVAAYLVSQALGWPLIPETVLRDGPYGPGMVQRWIGQADLRQSPGPVDVFASGEVPDGYLPVLRAEGADGTDAVLAHADDPRLLRMAVLDVVLNNADRKGGHILCGSDGAIYGVDHGICLHAEPKLRTVLWGWAGQKLADGLLADVRALGQKLAGGQLAAQLAAHISPAEVQALTLRVEQLLREPVMPVPHGPRPIPWPAF